MTPKSLFLKTLLPLFMVAIMGFYIIWDRIPDKIAKTLTQSLQTPVFVGNATISPSKLGLQKIVVNSPKSSSLSKAFSCDTFSVHAWLGNYLKKNIEIDLIELDTVYLGLEFDSVKDATGNWTRLMSNLAQASYNNKSSSSKTVLIKKLVIRNISCQVVYNDRKDKVINLKPIAILEFENISSDGGFPVEQLSNSVLGKMLKEVFVRENLNDMLNKLIQPQQQIDKFLKPFKWF
jgi:hypothetical protein